MTFLGRLAPWVAALIVLGGISFFLGSYQMDIYRKLLLWIALALSFNFLFGIAGQIAFSHFAFYGVGAYSVVVLLTKADLPLGLAVVGGLVVCIAVALVIAIPSTRLEGFYLALATLALAQLFIVVVGAWELTGREGGIQAYRLPPVFGFEIRGAYYTIVIAIMLLATLAILMRLDRSYFGRACRAIRDNPEAAEAMGVNVVRTKVIVYVLTSTLAGVAGMTYAFVDNIVIPPIFSLENVFTLLFMIIVGGTGRHAGAILGAILLYLARYFLEPLVGHYHLLVYGFIIVFVILFQPKGLMGIYDWAVEKVSGRPKGPPDADQPDLSPQPEKTP